MKDGEEEEEEIEEEEGEVVDEEDKDDKEEDKDNEEDKAEDDEAAGGPVLSGMEEPETTIAQAQAQSAAMSVSQLTAIVVSALSLGFAAL